MSTTKARVVIIIRDTDDGMVRITAKSNPHWPGPSAPEGTVMTPAQRTGLQFLGYLAERNKSNEVVEQSADDEDGDDL